MRTGPWSSIAHYLQYENVKIYLARNYLLETHETKVSSNLEFPF